MSDTKTRMKIATAISVSLAVDCLTGTWRVAKVNDAELLLNSWKIFRNERAQDYRCVESWRSTNCYQQTHSGFKIEHQISNVLSSSTGSIRNVNYYMHFL